MATLELTNTQTGEAETFEVEVDESGVVTIPALELPPRVRDVMEV